MILLSASFRSLMQLIGVLIIFVFVLIITYFTTKWVGGFPEASNDAYINGLLLLFCKNLEMKITQLSVEEKQTLKEIFSRSKPAKEHRKLRRRNPKL